jgi:hypothetical protein
VRNCDTFWLPLSLLLCSEYQNRYLVFFFIP